MTATRLNQVFGNVVMKVCSSTATATSTGKALGSIELDAGTWVVVGTAWFAGNATGRRYVKVSTTSGDVGTGPAFAGFAGDAGNPAATVMDIVQPATQVTYYLNVWQNSGGNLNAAGYISAVRIK